MEAERMEQEKKLRLKDEQDYETTQRRKYNTFLVSSNGEKEMSVRDFCFHVEQNKVVSIDDQADRFQRPSAQVVERIQELVDTCRLTGVVDGDRFIYISSDEMTRMASFIMKQKQATIREVAKSTHTLISL
jgi:ABC-type sulfate/molybdate transport systems ATPase subunit